VHLETIDLDSQSLCVANTHLLANSNKNALRTIQARTALYCIECYTDNIAKLKNKPSRQDSQPPKTSERKSPSKMPDMHSKAQDTTPSPIPVLFCGDFNSQPHSTTYQLLSTGHVPKDNPEMYVFGENIARDDINIRNNLSSLYGVTIGEPPKATVDYIWFTPNHMIPTRVMRIPQIESIPTEQYPSDHFALYGEFNFMNISQK